MHARSASAQPAVWSHTPPGWAPTGWLQSIVRTRCIARLAHRASPSEYAAEFEDAGWQSVERSVVGDVTGIGSFILARTDNQV